MTAYSAPEAVGPRRSKTSGRTSRWKDKAVTPCAVSQRWLMGEICLADEFILETSGLTKEFAGFFAVRDVSLKVRRGSIHALIGPNGAGKTTCFNLLTKFLQPSAGAIRYKGQDITAMAPADVARLGLVRSFQISAVFPHLTRWKTSGSPCSASTAIPLISGAPNRCSTGSTSALWSC